MARRLDWLLPSWLENVDAYSQSIDEDIVSVAYTIIVNLCIFLLCILIFSIIRQYSDDIYTCKLFVAPERTPLKLSTNSWFGWIKDVYFLSDELLVTKAGYESLFFIRFYRLCLKIVLYSSIYCIFILVPINGTGNSLVSYISFDRWSMTNISQGSSLCWFHLIGIYLISGITIYLVEKEFIIYAKYRHIFLRQTHAHLRTVLIEGIPHKLRSPASLKYYLQLLYPNDILHIRLGINLTYLESLLKNRNDVLIKLERCLYDAHEGHPRATILLPNLQQPIDAIKHYYQLLNQLNKAVEKEQQTIHNLIGSNDKFGSMLSKENYGKMLKVTEITGVKTAIDPNSSSNKISSTSGKIRKRKDSSDKRIPTKRDDLNSLGLSSYQTEVIKDSEDEEDIEQNKFVASADLDYFSDSDYNEEGDEEGLFAKLKQDFQPRSISRRKEDDTCFEWLESLCPTTLQITTYCKECVFGKARDDYHKLSNINKMDEDEEDNEYSNLLSSPEDRRLYLSKAFVTFKTFTSATIARQVIHMQLAGRLSVSEAPEPNDVTWMNLYMTRKGALLRRYIVEAFVLFLIIIWVAPVTLLSFIFSRDALITWIPSLGDLCDKSQMVESLVELAQPLVLVGIMNLLPPLLTALAMFEGCIALSVNQFRSFNRYFTFQIVNVFLVNTIAGSVIDCVKQIYTDPASTFSLLGSSLPKMGGFFTSYILVKAFTGLGLELIRFPAMFFGLIKYLFTHNKTPRDRKALLFFGSVRQMTNPGWFTYAKIYAQDMLLFVICATYSCIAPLTLIAGICYFSLAIYVYKHQMLYIYEPVYETGGKWWPIIARCFIVSLLFAQATMVGMMILKESYTQIYFLVLLFALTSSYYYYVSSIYVPLANQLPLDMAVSMDKERSDKDNLDKDEETSSLNQEELKGANDYSQPILRIGAVQPELEFSPEDFEDSTFKL